MVGKLLCCDIDQTITDHSWRIKKWYINGKLKRKAFSWSEIRKDPVSFNSVKALRILSKKYHILYTSCRPKHLYIPTFLWLVKNNYPIFGLRLFKNQDLKIKYIIKKSPDLFIDDFTRNHHLNKYSKDIKNIDKLIDSDLKYIIFRDNWDEIINKYG